MTPQVLALLNQAVQLFQAGRIDEAEGLLNKALKIHPRNFDALHILGVIKGIQNKHEEAKALLKKAIRIEPNNNYVHFNLAKALSETGRDEESLPHHRRATELAPNHPEAWLNYGKSLLNLTQLTSALSCFETAFALNPGYAEAWTNHGECLIRLHRYGEALVSLLKSLEVNPNLAEAWSSKGRALAELKRYDEAMACFDQATAIKPDLADGHVNRGIALIELKRQDQAVTSFDKAIAVKPDHARAYFNRGVALFELKRLDEALASVDQARALDPSISNLDGFRMHLKLMLCDWTQFDLEVRELLDKIDATPPRSKPNPFTMLPVPSSPAQQKRCAEVFTEDRGFAVAATYPRVSRPRREKITLGYFSADFHAHATSYLMAGLFEHHDRSAFELVAFSFGPRTHDDMQSRVKRSFDRFIDVRELSDDQVVRMARDLQVDIAVDLKGYTQDFRAGIFVQRAAPVQVNYLGFPCTMGAPFMDYLIADQVIIPVQDAVHYSEKIAWLPHCYQINDGRREIVELNTTRREQGLPEHGFVFCCLNNNYKITPDVFAIWMRLLQRVDGSVLWLLQDNPQAAANLRQQARAYGVDSDRLVFASRVPFPEHITRQQLADLFLDTFYCNAHTTASDALWAGLPVLTLLGQTFAGRVAASLLEAVGLPELIAKSATDYENVAFDLASNQGSVVAIREKLAKNRLAMPLFDTVLTTRHIEDAFNQMHSRYLQGLSPDHIRVVA